MITYCCILRGWGVKEWKRVDISYGAMSESGAQPLRGNQQGFLDPHGEQLPVFKTFFNCISYLKENIKTCKILFPKVIPSSKYFNAKKHSFKYI